VRYASVQSARGRLARASGTWGRVLRGAAAAAATAAAATAAALLGTAGPAAAQLVTGQVLGAGTTEPVVDVTLTLRAADGHVFAVTATDSAGNFRMHVARAGDYILTAERIGYTPVSSTVSVNLHEQVDVRITMDVAAVPLEPLTITARSYFDMGRLGEFYERMADNEKLGIGRFLTRDMIESRGAMEVSDLLRDFPRVLVLHQEGRGNHVAFRELRGECSPAIYIDGVISNRRERAFIDELVRPHDLEGVEIYHGLARLPGRYHDETGCGVVLLWTRREAAGPGRPFSWKRILITTGALIGVYAIIYR
jgi:hypothetical protein